MSRTFSRCIQANCMAYSLPTPSEAPVTTESIEMYFLLAEIVTTGEVLTQMHADNLSDYL